MALAENRTTNRPCQGRESHFSARRPLLTLSMEHLLDCLSRINSLTASLMLVIADRVAGLV